MMVSARITSSLCSHAVDSECPRKYRPARSLVRPLVVLICALAAVPLVAAASPRPDPPVGGTNVYVGEDPKLRLAATLTEVVDPLKVLVTAFGTQKAAKGYRLVQARVRLRNIGTLPNPSLTTSIRLVLTNGSLSQPIHELAIWPSKPGQKGSIKATFAIRAVAKTTHVRLALGARGLRGSRQWNLNR